MPEAPGAQPIDQFWSRPDLRAALADTVRGILQNPRLQNTNIVSLGESPAVLSAIARPSIEARGNTVSFIPFSGFRFEEQKPADALDRKTISFTAHAPDMAGYRQFLEAQGVSPQQIIKNFKEHGTKTAFFDVPASGGTVGSFMHVMMDWAKSQGVLKDFVKSTELLTVKETDRAHKNIYFPKHGVTIEPINVPPGQILYASPDTGRVSMTSVSELMLDRPGGRSKRDAGAGGFRLVPYYRPSHWGGPPAPLDEGRIANAERVLGHLAPIGEALKQDQAAGVRGSPATIPVRDAPATNFVTEPAKVVPPFSSGTVTTVRQGSPDAMIAHQLGRDVAIVLSDGEKSSMVRIAVGSTHIDEYQRIVADLGKQFDPKQTTVMLIGGQKSSEAMVTNDYRDPQLKTSEETARYLRMDLSKAGFQIDHTDLHGVQSNRTVGLDGAGRLQVTNPNGTSGNYSIDLNEWRVRRAALYAGQASEPKLEAAREAPNSRPQPGPSTEPEARTSTGLKATVSTAWRGISVADTAVGKTLASIGLAAGLGRLGQGVHEGNAPEVLKGAGQTTIASIAFHAVRQRTVEWADALAAKTAASVFAADAEVAKAAGLLAGKTVGRTLPFIGAGVVLTASQLSAAELERQGRAEDASTERKIGGVEAGLNLLSVPGVVLGDITRAGMNTYSRVLGDGSRGELSMIEKARFFLSDMRVQQDLNTKIVGNLPLNVQAGDHPAVQQLTARVAETRTLGGALTELDRYLPNSRGYNARAAREMTANGHLAVLLDGIKQHIPAHIKYDPQSLTAFDLKEIKSALEMAKGQTQSAMLGDIKKLVDQHPREAMLLYGKKDPELLAKYLSGTSDERIVARKTEDIQAAIQNAETVKAAELLRPLETGPQSNSILYKGITPTKLVPDLLMKAEPPPLERQVMETSKLPAEGKPGLKTAEAEPDKTRKAAPQLQA